MSEAQINARMAYLNGSPSSQSSKDVTSGENEVEVVPTTEVRLQ